MESKTQIALGLLEADPNMTPYQAAKQVGITPTTLYTAMKRRQANAHLVICPCCGSRVDPERIKQG